MSILILSACSSIEPKKNVDQLISEDKGRIVGETKSVLASILLIPIGQHLEIHFKSVDGVALKSSVWSGFPTEIEVPAGERELEIRCSGDLDNSIYLDTVSNIEVDVEAGHTYYIKAGLIQGGCIGIPKDITNK